MDLRQERLERPPIQQRRDLRQPVTPTLLRPTYGTINPTQLTDPLASHEILRRSTPSWNHGSSIRAKVSMLSLSKHEGHARLNPRPEAARRPRRRGGALRSRSVEHTSELQSLMRISYAVFCLKKKHKNKNRDRAQII